MPSSDDGTVMRCEIKYLNHRYTKRNEQAYEERLVGMVASNVPKQYWWKSYCFCFIRHFNQRNQLERERLVVNSQPLRQLLSDVVRNQSDTVNVNDEEIDSPYYALFHHRQNLAEIGRERFREDQDSLSHLNLLLRWIEAHFELDIQTYEACLTSDVKVVSFDHLWTLFPAGTICYSKMDDYRDRALKIRSCWYDEGAAPRFFLCVTFVDSDGEKFVERKTEVSMPKYSGGCNIRKLLVIPLSLHEDSNNLRAYLIARGRKFESCAIGQNFVRYDGIALKGANQRHHKIYVRGRIMIDGKTFLQNVPSEDFVITGLVGDPAKSVDSRHKGVALTPTTNKLSDDDACLTCPSVRGFSFDTMQFLEFFVDNISSVTWNTQSFDSLVLDESLKRTVKALVTTYSNDIENGDDILNGKGHNLVCVLHGPPGVGKTLTAKCVAEYTKRPLFVISSGDLVSPKADFERALTSIMRDASTWGAILLIEEADVILERRSSCQQQHNGIISVFLRLLDSYSGILFLTTNRLHTFDDAFRSRVHMPIRYTDLSPDSRFKIWRHFCNQLPGGADIHDDQLRILSASNLNGGQIKNVVTVANSLAAYDGLPLNYWSLKTVVAIQERFEKDLTNNSGVDYSVPGSAKKYKNSEHLYS